MFKKSILIFLLLVSITKYHYFNYSYWSLYYLRGNQYYYAFTNDTAKYYEAHVLNYTEDVSTASIFGNTLV